MDRFTLSFSPHIRDNSSVTRIMLDVIIALLPATIAGVYFFGTKALIVIIVSVLAAVGTEALIQFLCKKPVTVIDLSAVVTGLLLALNLPPAVPLYIPIVGSVFAIAVCKQCFGGLGNNFVNPALAARVFLATAWPVAMTTWTNPGVDTIASATPLALLKAGNVANLPGLWDMAIGNVSGCIGETSAIALVIGGIYLLVRKVISWRIPVVYIVSAAVFSLLFGGFEYLPQQLLTGGLMIGAFFMATDYATSPVTPWAQVVFAVGCGFITMIIRYFGGYPEGVSYSILLMNLAVPLLERAFKPRLFGEVKAK